MTDIRHIAVIDIGKTNVDIAVVYRGKLAAPAKQSVAEHDKVSEVYHVIDGSATLMTGPDIVDLKPRPADDRAVRLLNGPGGNGASIRNGVTYQLKAGDVVVIPAGTGHLFTRIDDTYEKALDAATESLSQRYAMDFRKAAQRYAALGTPQDVAETIFKFQQAGVRHLILDFVGPYEERDQQIERFAAEAMPLLSGLRKA